MEHKYRRIERRFLTAFVLLIGRIICADRCISASELKMLPDIEDHFGFDHTLMADASKLTLANAISALRELDPDIRREMLESLHQLASADRVIERHEALLLLTLRSCLEGGGRVISCPEPMKGLTFCGCILYTESSKDTERHHEICSQWELLKLLLHKEGLQMLYIEKMIEGLTAMDREIMSRLLGYMAPRMTSDQLSHLQERMRTMDSPTFCERVLVDTLQLKECRQIEPSLLVGLDNANFLKIPLTAPLMDHIRQLLADYTAIASPIANVTIPATGNQEWLYDGYGRLFFSLLVKAEPRKSSLSIWPNKSEFEFPEAGLHLKLNQQEATLYTLILLFSLTNDGKGLPLSYSAQQKRIEELYRTIYCRKKLVETSEVIYPENLAPIRARIEKKMREQLGTLDNLEDYIPYNENHEGFYRVAVPSDMVQVIKDLYGDTIGLTEFRW